METAHFRVQWPVTLLQLAAQQGLRDAFLDLKASFWWENSGAVLKENLVGQRWEEKRDWGRGMTVIL